MTSMSAREFVLVEVGDKVAEVTIARPKALNALSSKVLHELEQSFAELAAVKDLACVILTGAGDRAFVAGADIGEMRAMTKRQAEEFCRTGHRVFAAIESFPTPVIAAVNGFALGGGCELALACDIIYAAANAKFGQPEVKLGLIPGFGGTVRLPRKVGLAAAAEWIFTGEVYDAEAAEKIGLVRAVLPPGELMPRVRAIAHTIAQRAPLAVRAAKQVMVEGLATHPAEAANFEQQAFIKVFDTSDLQEGTQAFLDKREPTFRGE